MDSVLTPFEDASYMAVFGPVELNRFAALLLADLGPLCFRRTTAFACKVMWDEEELTSMDTLHPVQGTSLVIQIMARSPSVMASSSTGLSAQGQDGSEGVHHSTSSVFWVGSDDDLAATPDRPAVNLQAISHLRAYWSQLGHDGPDVPLHTWFLAPERALSCAASRLLLTGPDPESWDTTLRSLWSDVLHLDESYEIFWVSPQPFLDLEQPYTGHLIVVQQSAPSDRDALLLSGQFGNVKLQTRQS